MPAGLRLCISAVQVGSGPWGRAAGCTGLPRLLTGPSCSPCLPACLPARSELAAKEEELTALAGEKSELDTKHTELRY